MNPFDVRIVLLAKHAQHVVIVHFPIALSLMSWFFDLLARSRRSPALAAAIALTWRLGGFLSGVNVAGV
jgi:uncharacterized membrane protein